MLFNLKPGDTLYSDKHRLATVKVNDKEGRNLPTEIYYIGGSQHFSIHHFRKLLSYTVSSSFQDLRLKVEKVKGDYKLALIGESNHSDYYYTNSNIITMPEYCRSKEYDTQCTLLEKSRVLIDPKDIISSENIIAILEELERYNSMLEIRIGEKASSDANNNVNIYNPLTHKMIGVMNNIVPYFYESAHQEYTLMLYTLYHMNGLEKENSYFTVKKLGNNYVGCISYENSTCKNFYNLNPDSFGYEHDNSPGPYPYYYNLENFGNFLEIDLNTKEYIILKEEIKDLKYKIERLERADIQGPSGKRGESGIPGQKGDKGDKGNVGALGKDGLPGLHGLKGEPGVKGGQGIQGLQGQKGKSGLDGKDADPSEVATKIFSEKKEELIDAISKTPIRSLGGITLKEYLREEIVQDEDLRNIVAEALKDDDRFKKDIRGEKGTAGIPGHIGPPGFMGFPGYKGEPGEPGPKGVDGVPGIDGTPGLPGFRGESGAQGPIGPTGNIGIPGKDGLQGIKGEKGNTSNAIEIATELVTNKKAELGEAVLNANGIKGENLATQIAGKINFNSQEFVNKIDVAKLTEGVVSKLSLEEAKNIIKDTVSKITSDTTKKNNPDPDAFQKYEKFAEKLAELLVDKSSMSEIEAHNLIKGNVSDWGLAKYLLIHSDLNEQTKALDMVKQKMDKEKLVEYLLEYAKLKGNVNAAKTVVENIVHQFFDTQKVGELGRAVLEAKDDQDKKVLVNDPVLREGIAEELRKNPGQMKGDTGAPGIDGLPGTQGSKGDKGDIGTLGSKGDKGNVGSIGPQGLQGPKGHIGRSGPKGDRGDQGLQGQKGERGFNGTRGEKGDIGAPGPAGLKGNIGPQGFKGADGLPGMPGPKGIDANPEEVAQKLINNGTIANQILEYREEGDLVLEQQIAGRLIYDKNIHEGIATELIENRAKELAEALLNSANDTLVEKFANSTELIQSISEELRKNPGKIQGPKGDIGLQGVPGIKGSQGIQGLKGDKGDTGMPGSKGDMGDQGLVGSEGLKGDKGEEGPQGFNGTQGEPGINGLLGMPGPKGDKGDIGLQGPKGHVGKSGLKGDKGDTGSVGKDGIGAAEANQFLHEIKKAKNETIDAKKAAEFAKIASEESVKEVQDAEDKITKLHTKVVNLTEEAKAFKEEADDFANRAAKSKKDVEKLYSKVEDIFCKTNPKDQICPVPRGKRGIEKLNNPLAGSGASRPTSFISQVINFFYPSIKQDEYKAKNKIQELNQTAKIIDAVDIVTKFEKVLEETALKCGIAKKGFNFDPIELQSNIINKSLSNGRNRDELLKILCVAATKSCPNYKKNNKFLDIFKDHMEKMLKNNEKLVSTEKMLADNEQPRSFMSDVTLPSNFSAINQYVVGHLR